MNEIDEEVRRIIKASFVGLFSVIFFVFAIYSYIYIHELTHKSICNYFGANAEIHIFNSQPHTTCDLDVLDNQTRELVLKLNSYLDILTAITMPFYIIMSFIIAVKTIR